MEKATQGRPIDWQKFLCVYVKLSNGATEVPCEGEASWGASEEL